MHHVHNPYLPLHFYFFILDTAPGTSTSSKQAKVPLRPLNWNVNSQHMKHAKKAGGSIWKGVPRFNVPQARFTEHFGIKPVEMVTGELLQ